jgi:ribosomal protein S27AE
VETDTTGHAGKLPETRSMIFENAAMYADPKARTCPNCGPYHEMERYGRRYECPSCGLRLSGSGLSLEIISRPGLELELEGGSTIYQM